MATDNPYLHTNRWQRLDHALGLRAWGLVLYGTLPASLFGLGVLRITLLDSPELGSFVPFFLVGIAPVTVLFLLVHERLKAWYLLRDGLYVRTMFLTLMILLFSTIVSLAAGHITGKYMTLPWSEWLALAPEIRWRPLLESALLGIAALVGSSTLFLTAIKEESGLPGLPSTEFVQCIKSLRNALIVIKSEPIWQTPQYEVSPSLSVQTQSAKETCLQLACKSSFAPQHSQLCKELANDLGALESAIRKVARTSPKWSDYFAHEMPPGLNPNDQALRTSVYKLAKVKLNA